MSCRKTDSLETPHSYTGPLVAARRYGGGSPKRRTMPHGGYPPPGHSHRYTEHRPMTTKHISGSAHIQTTGTDMQGPYSRRASLPARHHPSTHSSQKGRHSPSRGHTTPVKCVAFCQQKTGPTNAMNPAGLIAIALSRGQRHRCIAGCCTPQCLRHRLRGRDRIASLHRTGQRRSI